MKKQITAADIMPAQDFARKRSESRHKIIQIKKNRRVPLGPDVTIYFENFQTLLWQIQEMLHIEKGGQEQLEDELKAYNPLVPQGNELVATVMIEIEDPVRRQTILNQLGNFEDHLFLRFQSHIIQGVPEEDVERTNSDGKTSSVHFIHWPLTPTQVQEFCDHQCDIILECTHPNYSHKVILSENARQALMNDLEK